ncbi:transporter [Ensifer sp. Root31]|uniref:TolC family outer membrane protein n=1 Tax=Ensifer sp. Root31 TaxID=1736512 RepID=UPI00070F902E|nr:TolC family outer membrane protein [Ensifer sp. Root31]KQU88100.1 transporter [Ensifer sp. Root31]
MQLTNFVAASLLVGFCGGAVHAETISDALAKAYRNNPTLNASRAGTRATNEGVAIAKSAGRPTIFGSGEVESSAGPHHEDQDNQRSRINSATFGVEIQQSLFDGFQTRNSVATAKAKAFAAEQTLRNDEQSILYDAASVYLGLICDRRIVALREQNLRFSEEQVRTERARRAAGEGTRTNIAQAEASHAAAKADLADARAQVKASTARYRQIVGDEPGKLDRASPITNLLPLTLDNAVVGSRQHPAILATEYLVKAAAHTARSAEGALLPKLTANAGVSRSVSDGPAVNILPGTEGARATVGITLTIPIFEGGRTSAEVRQSKEALGQAQFEVDSSRRQVLTAVAAAWTQYTAARASAEANLKMVASTKLALKGVVSERNVGQRTTMDVLEQQADLIKAQVELANSERDESVASYAILAAIGQLSVKKLGLNVMEYSSREHYDATKDKWHGLRTTDGD